MSENQLLLIDLSALAHQIWHSDTANPDPSRVSTQIVARVRALASAHPHAAICCDSGKSWRADVDPTYKAQRDTENRAPLRHQVTLACETLAKDGFPVWAVPGAEADDIIATAVRLTREQVPDGSILIISADKDLLQLVDDGVTMKKLTDGAIMDREAVIQKFGVTPVQMTDYLCICGDKSDNIKGAEGVGPVTAAAILKKFGNLTEFYTKLSAAQFPPDMKRRAKMLAESFGIGDKQRESLIEFQSRYATVRKLVALKDDVEIPFHEISVERTAVPMVEEPEMSEDTPEYDDLPPFAEQLSNALKAGHGTMSESAKAAVMEAAAPLGRELNQNDALSALGGATQRVAERIAENERPKLTKPDPRIAAAVERINAGVRAELAPYAPVDFSQQLEPRSMNDAVQLAQRMFESRLFGAYGTPQAVLATVLAGRELGIPAMASLRAFHVIDGKPTMSAGTIQSLVIKSGKAKYFRCTERTAERATFVTKRGDDPEMALTYTIEEGKAAWPKDEAAFKKSGWGRNPADMLVARASSKLARLVYPDVVSGLYAPEEME